MLGQRLLRRMAVPSTHEYPLRPGRSDEPFPPDKIRRSVSLIEPGKESRLAPTQYRVAVPASPLSSMTRRQVRGQRGRATGPRHEPVVGLVMSSRHRSQRPRSRSALPDDRKIDSTAQTRSYGLPTADASSLPPRRRVFATRYSGTAGPLAIRDFALASRGSWIYQAEISRYALPPAISGDY
jgi:hypothetical protein